MRSLNPLGLRPLPPRPRIALVAPSSPLRGLDLEPTLAWFRARGAEPVLMPHVGERWRYLAGTDTQRAADLTAAFLDPQFDAVWCARGGYGCARLIPHLDVPALAATGKLFVGYSDITSLHLALNQAGLPTVHGPMGGEIGKAPAGYVGASVKALLGNRWHLPSEVPRAEPVRGGRATGRLVGGCLRLIGDSLGTSYAPDFHDAIVLMEDVSEAPYRVDATLTHLLNAGLNRAAGIVVGQFTGTDEKNEIADERTTWREIVEERLGGLGIPIMVGFPFGHIANPVPVPLGILAEMDADAGTLNLREPLFRA